MQALNHDPTKGDNDGSHDSKDDHTNQPSRSDRTHCLNCEMMNKAEKCNYKSGENMPCNGCQRIPGERKRPLPCHSADKGSGLGRVYANPEPRDSPPTGTGCEDSYDVPRGESQDGGRAVHPSTTPQIRRFKGTQALKLLQQTRHGTTTQQEALRRRETDSRAQVDELKVLQKRARSPDGSELYPAQARGLNGMPHDARNTLATSSTALGRGLKHHDYQDKRHFPSTTVYPGLPSHQYVEPANTSQGYLSNLQPVIARPASNTQYSQSVGNGRWLPLLTDVGAQTTSGYRPGYEARSHVIMDNSGHHEDAQTPGSTRVTVGEGNSPQPIRSHQPSSGPRIGGSRWIDSDMGLVAKLRSERVAYDVIAQQLSTPRTRVAMEHRLTIANSRMSLAKRSTTTGSNAIIDTGTDVDRSLAHPIVNNGTCDSECLAPMKSEHAPPSTSSGAVSISTQLQLSSDGRQIIDAPTSSLD